MGDLSNGPWRSMSMILIINHARRGRSPYGFLSGNHAKGEAEKHELWMLFLDGSANSEGSGVGEILVSPQGEETKLTVWLQF